MFEKKKTDKEDEKIMRGHLVQMFGEEIADKLLESQDVSLLRNDPDKLITGLILSHYYRFLALIKTPPSSPEWAEGFLQMSALFRGAVVMIVVESLKKVKKDDTAH